MQSVEKQQELLRTVYNVVTRRGVLRVAGRLRRHACRTGASARR
jgi:hypothetical protein